MASEAFFFSFFLEIIFIFVWMNSLLLFLIEPLVTCLFYPFSYRLTDDNAESDG